MAPPKNSQSNASTSEQTQAPAGKGPSRSVSIGVTLGRIAEKLVELDAEEKVALSKSPEVIRASFAKKREEALEKLTKEQREAVLTLAKVLSPKDAE